MLKISLGGGSDNAKNQNDRNENKRGKNDKSDNGKSKNDRSEAFLTYYIFKEKALNTFDSALAEHYKRNSTLIKSIKLPLKSLESILDENLPRGVKIDFLSVDCEGLDLSVLKSNNFSKYRPRFIVVEIAFENLEGIFHSPIATFLSKHSYKIIDKMGNSVIFGECS